MKGRVFTISIGAIFLLAIFLNFVSAKDPVLTCDDSQSIFSLASQSNSHVGAHDSYSTKICFNQFFLGTGSGTRNNDKILGVSAATNAHAESPAKNIYSNAIKYDGVVCELKSSSCKTVSGSNKRGTYLAFFSADTNSHVEVPPTAYTLKLCCASTTVDAICNYDGICERGDQNTVGESALNCEDCLGKNTCGTDNNVIDGNEVCDGSNLNNKQCSDFSGFSGDGLRCKSDCSDFDTSACLGGKKQWCDDSNNNPRSWKDSNGVSRDIASCSNYNLLEPISGWDKNMPEFKKIACGFDCDHGFSQDPSVPSGATGGCAWADENGGSCFANYTIQGTQCKIEVTNDGQCNPDTNTKVVSLKVTNTNGGNPDDCKVCPAGSEKNGNVETCDQKIPCPQVLQLPFFSSIQFIVAISIIVAIYFVMVNKKKLRIEKMMSQHGLRAAV